MARTQFSFTFTNAQPGSAVRFFNSAHEPIDVYLDATTKQPDGRPVILDSSNSVSIYADASVVVATTVDGAGVEISGTAQPGGSVTVADGTAGHNPFSSGGSSAVSELLLTLAADFPLTGGDDFPTFQVGRQTGTDITLDNDGNTIIVHKTGLYIATLHPSISTSGATNPALSMWIDCADAFNGELIQCTGLPITPLLPVTGSGVLPAESRLAPNFQFVGGGTNALQSALTFVSVAGPL